MQQKKIIKCNERKKEISKNGHSECIEELKTIGCQWCIAETNLTNKTSKI